MKQQDPYLQRKCLEDFDWGNLNSLKTSARATVSVVVPVYGALTETLHCIHSVLSAKTSLKICLIVIDDCSPDDRVFEQLSALANERGLFEVWRNDVNRGFVYSVNRGIFAASGDVILLNSDTIVSNYWVDKLVDIANSDFAIASVSPMSNNATILSYPHINRENDLVDGLSCSEIDTLFTDNIDLTGTIEVPVNVGSCMLITQRALQVTGAFDEGLFGLGYGEESDWCMRANYKGYKHVVATNTYVYHKGGSVSFSEKTLKRQALAGHALAIRYPEYRELIGRFCSRDVLLPARRNVDAKRLMHHLSRYKGGVVLHVSHALGGGTEKYIREIAKILSDIGVGSLFARPDNVGRLTINVDPTCDTPNLVFSCAEDVEIVDKMFKTIELRSLHIHNTIGFSPEAKRFLTGLRLSKTVTLHDYVSICPQLTLLDENYRYCGVKSGSNCNICLRTRRPPVPAESVSSWRKEWHGILKTSQRVIAPSAFVKEAVNRAFPDIPISIVPHFEPAKSTITEREDIDDAALREIALLGNFGIHKGHDIIRSCALDAFIRQLPLKFIVLGSVDLNEGEFGGKLKTMGPYCRENLGEWLSQVKCQIGFLPSVWPETFSYVLSEFFEFGLYPVVFNLGAQAERVRAAGRGLVLEMGMSASAINDFLLSISIPAADIKATNGEIEADRHRRNRSYLAKIYGSELISEPPPEDGRWNSRSRAPGI